MIYILIYIGVFVALIIVLTLWGKFDPKVKSENAKYEKSLEGKSSNKKTIHRSLDNTEVRTIMKKTEKTYHENGSIHVESELNEKGERHGITKIFHENGQLQVEVYWTNGIQDDGTIISYHDNGIKARKVIHLNGKFNGEFSEWHENGQLKRKSFYEDGLITGVYKTWDNYGNKKQDFVKQKFIDTIDCEKFRRQRHLQEQKNIEEVEVDWLQNIGPIYKKFIDKDEVTSTLQHTIVDEKEFIYVYSPDEENAKNIIETIIENNGGFLNFDSFENEDWHYFYSGDLFYIFYKTIIPDKLYAVEINRHYKIEPVSSNEYDIQPGVINDTFLEANRLGNEDRNIEAIEIYESILNFIDNFKSGSKEDHELAKIEIEENLLIETIISTGDTHFIPIDGIYFNLGLSYIEEENFLLAKEAYEKAIKVNNDSEARVYHYLGATKVKLGDFTSCIEHFNTAIEKNPKYYDSYYMRSVAYASDQSEYQNIDLALKDIMTYLKHYPEDKSALKLLESLSTDSGSNRSNVENSNTENILYKKDMSGLMLYFKKMNNMERLFNELTNAIRNDYSVKQYLIDANIMDDQEMMRIVASGFTDISSFLKGMLEIEENDELRKDYNACLEVITTLDKSEKKFMDELNNFDSKGISEKYNIEEKNLDINYWYDFILTRVDLHLKVEKPDNDLDNILYENIWSHADEYWRTHENRSLEDKRIISQIRILCYGHIYVCLKNSGKDDKLSSLKILHSKASLYGAIKFALFSGVSKGDIREWFPAVVFEEKLIAGHNPFEKIIQSLYKTNDDKSDFSKKIKIIFDKEKRLPIYDLSSKMKSNSPSWFKGPFYIKDGLVESVETGNKLKLSYLEKSIFTEIQFNKLLIEKLFEKNIKREDFEQPFLSYLVLVVDSGTSWFESNNKDAFNKLFNN